MSETRPLSAREAAAALGVSDRTIRRAILDGKLVATKAGRSFLIDPLSLERFRGGLADATLKTPREPGFGSGSGSQLVGRERDIASVLDAMRDPSTRLLTLTGPGGVGKTSMAHAVAAALGPDMPDGSLFVPLATIDRPADVPGLIAETGGLYLGDRTAEAAIDAWLTGSARLLVLDNIEHVLASATFIGELMERHPELLVLATSREALGLAGEIVVEVPPLALTAEDRVEADLRSASPAVRLLLQRIKEARPEFVADADDFVDGAEIVRQLDGLPLAIELAAAFADRADTATIRRDLNERLLRQPLSSGRRTLTGAIAWSYDLLDEQDRRAMRWLALLPSGVAPDLARLLLEPELEPYGAIRLADEEPPIQPDVLDRLTRKHLLTQTQPNRWAMLETTRVFALRELDRTGERDAAMARLAHLVDTMSRQFWDEEMGPRQRAWTARLTVELDVIRLVLRWAETRGDWTMLVRIAGHLLIFWQNRGRFVEAAAWLDRGIAGMPVDAVEDRTRGLIALAYHRSSMAHRSDASHVWEEALALLAAVPNPRLEVIVREQLADKLQDEGQLEAAEAQSRLALTVARETGDPTLEALALHALGMSIALKGMNAEGRVLLNEAVELIGAQGDSRRTARIRNNLGLLASQAGELDVATKHYRVALSEYRSLNEQNAIAVTLSNYADAALKQGHYAIALEVSLEALEASQRAGANRLIGIAQLNRAIASFHLGMRDEAFALFDSTLPGMLEIGKLIILAEALEIYGQLLGQVERWPMAAFAFGGAQSIWKESGAALDVDTRAASLRETMRGRQVLGHAEFDRFRDLGATAGMASVLRRLRLANLATQSDAPDDRSPLSERERAVLRLVAEGLTDREIGDVLFVSPRTIATHVARILDKLGVETRTAAATLAVRRGYIT